jgi:hypothetical protein
LQLKSTSAQHASRTMGGGEVLFFWSTTSPYPKHISTTMCS